MPAGRGQPSQGHHPSPTPGPGAPRPPPSSPGPPELGSNPSTLRSLVPGSRPPPQAPVNSFLPEQGPGALSRGQGQSRRMSRHSPAGRLCGAGLVFQVSVNGGFLFSTETKPRAPCPLSCWGILGIAGKSAQVFLAGPSPAPVLRSSGPLGAGGTSREGSPASRKPGSHPRPLRVLIGVIAGLAGVGAPVEMAREVRVGLGAVSRARRREGHSP